jgi:DNA-binding HxlR family transcriptional regulator
MLWKALWKALWCRIRRWFQFDEEPPLLQWNVDSQLGRVIMHHLFDNGFLPADDLFCLLEFTPEQEMLDTLQVLVSKGLVEAHPGGWRLTEKGDGLDMEMTAIRTWDCQSLTPPRKRRRKKVVEKVVEKVEEKTDDNH